MQLMSFYFEVTEIFTAERKYLMEPADCTVAVLQRVPCKSFHLISNKENCIRHCP